MTTWKRPTFVEIDMSAEVGSYQEDPTRDERDERDEPIADTITVAAAVEDDRRTDATAHEAAKAP